MENMPDEVHSAWRLLPTTPRLAVTSQRSAEGFDEGSPVSRQRASSRLPWLLLRKKPAQRVQACFRGLRDKGLDFFMLALGLTGMGKLPAGRPQRILCYLTSGPHPMSLNQSVQRRGLML